MGKNNLLGRAKKVDEHFKMYKDGKRWMFASLAMLSLGIGFAAQSNVVSADTTTPSSAVTTSAASSSAAPASSAASSAAPTSSAASSATGSTATITKTEETHPTVNDENNVGPQPTESGLETVTATDPALIKGSIFGDQSSTAENSATTGLGEQEEAEQAVKTANDDTNRTTGEYGQVTGNNGEVSQNSAANDALDQTVVATTTTAQDKIGDQTTTADIYNDQGAISADANNPEERATTIYTTGQNTGISASLIGSNQHGVSVGVPDNIAASLSVGTFEVVDKSAVGLVLKNSATNEFVQITDPTVAQDYSIGDSIDGKAVIYSNFNGDGLQYITSFVTNTIDGASTALEDVGSTLLNGINGVVTLANGALKLVSFVPGVSAITDALDAYQVDLQAAVDNIENLEDYGSNLMKGGITDTSLVDATYDPTTGIITAKSEDSVSTSIGNMVDSYITGWTSGITDSVQKVLGLSTTNADGTEDTTNPWTTLTNAITDAASGNPLLQAAADTILNGLASFATSASNSIASAINGVQTTATNAVTDGIAQVVQDAIDGGLGVSQTAAIPVKWTDPSLEGGAGTFTAETFKTNTVLYDKDVNADTTIAYQNVDKTQLADLIQQANADGTDTTAAQAVYDNGNASQEDVDQAIRDLGGTITIKTTSVVANAVLNPIVGDAGQTSQEALDANAGTAISITPVVGSDANIVVTLGSGDLTASGEATTADDGSTVQGYTLSAAGKAKLVKAADGYNVENVDALLSTVSVPAASETTTPTTGTSGTSGTSTPTTGTSGTSGTSTPTTGTSGTSGTSTPTTGTSGTSGTSTPTTGTSGTSGTSTPTTGTSGTSGTSTPTTGTSGTSETSTPTTGTSGTSGTSTPTTGTSGTSGTSTPTTGTSGTSETSTPTTGTSGTSGTSTPTTGTSGTSETSTPTTGTSGTSETSTPTTGTSGTSGTSTPTTGTTGTSGTSTPTTGTSGTSGTSTPTTGTSGTSGTSAPTTGTTGTSGVTGSSTPTSGTSGTSGSSSTTTGEVPEPGNVAATTDPKGNVTITGTGTPGATVIVRNPGGDVVGEGTVDGNGEFTVKVTGEGVTPGEVLGVTQVVDGNPSPSVSVTVPNPAPKPGNVAATTDPKGNVTITGTGTPGATVIVRNPDGDVVGEGTVDGNGDFTVKVPSDSVKPGETLEVTQVVDGNPSSSVSVTVPNKVATPGTVVATVEPNGNVEVTGTGTPGATIIVHGPNGEELGQGVVGEDGHFRVTLPAGSVTPGEVLEVSQVVNGQASAEVPVTVPGNGNGGTKGNGSNGNGTQNTSLKATASTKANSGSQTANAAGKLPQTSEAQNNLADLGVLGMFLMSLLALFGLKRRKRN
ncbi:Ig-like domain-containing protein [Pediococcus siamensis]|uniref:Ig-like domain-containing protein n=1 Tax=Pediococcus siamensis TaxID=381829 RepID=UPI0039A36B26